MNELKTILFSIFLIQTSMSAQTIFDASQNENPGLWYILNDRVMGGRSAGTYSAQENGEVLFSGKISLENNGGFSSLRYNFKPISRSEKKYIQIRLKGTKSRYQLRLKEDRTQFFSYVQSFETNGEWQIIKLKLDDFYPVFRGKRLNSPNFSSEQIEEVIFLIGNKKAESFQLSISKIELIP